MKTTNPLNAGQNSIAFPNYYKNFFERCTFYFTCKIINNFVLTLRNLKLDTLLLRTARTAR